MADTIVGPQAIGNVTIPDVPELKRMPTLDVPIPKQPDIPPFFFNIPHDLIPKVLTVPNEEILTSSLSQLQGHADGLLKAVSELGLGDMVSQFNDLQSQIMGTMPNFNNIMDTINNLPNQVPNFDVPKQLQSKINDFMDIQKELQSQIPNFDTLNQINQTLSDPALLKDMSNKIKDYFKS